MNFHFILINKTYKSLKIKKNCDVGKYEVILGNKFS
jgi:hypothetical protein